MGKKKNENKEKSLEKMTSKELRELAMTIPEISGVHGMNKTELISAIKKSRGIEETVKPKGDSGREIKEKIKQFKIAEEKAVETKDEKMASIYHKRIIRLKKKSRRMAA